MNLMKLFSRNAKNRTSSTRQGTRKFQPEIDQLESRMLLSTTAVLDFDGEWVWKSQMQDHYDSDFDRNLWLSSFRTLFNSSNSHLDVNNDGMVNGTDADLAIDRIVAKVRQDFAPYDLNIIVGDQDTYQSRLTDSFKGDVICMISGGDDNVENDENAGGWAPVDKLNKRDDYAFVFGNAWTSLSTDERFINAVARAISHEVGHTFGLEHITADSGNDATTHHIMAEPASDTDDDRDWGNDFNFQNTSFRTGDGTNQNTHLYLNYVLGHSTRPWAAVLTPGVLTLHSESRRGSFTLHRTTDGRNDWTIMDWSQGLSHHLDPDSRPDVNSLNPFDASVSFIRFYGSQYGDFLWVDPTITTSVSAFGNAGNDILYGGGGNDTLWGGYGDDRLYGRDGADWLLGESDNDYLDGGHDHVQDQLWSGAGSDTIVQHRHLRWSGSGWLWYWYWESEDNIGFYDSTRDTIEYQDWTD